MRSLLVAVVILAVMSSRFCDAERQHRTVLAVNNGERFGDWSWIEMCPENYYAIGFSIRVEKGQGRGDDTALNGIRLHCAQGDAGSFMYKVESHSGFFGDWSEPQYCPSGVLTSFQLRVEPFGGGNFDDTAANNIKFRCSSNPEMEGPGMSWGEYGNWSEDCTNGGICGIQTKMEAQQGSGDDTTLNDVKLFCCDK